MSLCLIDPDTSTLSLIYYKLHPLLVPMQVSRSPTKDTNIVPLYNFQEGEHSLYKISRHSARGTCLLEKCGISPFQTKIEQPFKLEPTVRQLSYRKLQPKEQ